MRNESRSESRSVRKSASGALRLTNLGLLTAIALGLYALEAALPPLTSVPGVKMGLANIITLAVYYLYNRRDALMVLLVRVFLAAAVSGRMMTLPYSLSGGLFCFAATALILPLFPLKRLWLLSMIGAVFHNIGQIGAAIVMTGTPDIIWYLPLLLVSGLVSGCFTGVCCQQVLIRMSRLRQAEVRTNRFAPSKHQKEASGEIQEES